MIKDTRYIIKRVIIGVLICLILSFIRSCEVQALDISDFQNITGGDIGQNQTKNTYLTTSQLSSNSLQTISHDYTGLNIDVSNKKYIIIQLNRSWNLSNEQYCWQSSSNVGSQAATSGGCSFESNTNWSEKVYITTDNTGLCAYDGTYAICPVGNANTITAVHYQMFYDLTPLTSTSIQGYELKFTLNTRLARYIYFSNGSGVSADITNKIEEQIQEQQQQTQDVIDNANQNTQEQIESQKVCKKYDKTFEGEENKLLNNNGTLTDANGYKVTNLIKLTKKDELKVINNFNSPYVRYCFYYQNKNVISCGTADTITVGELINIPDGTYYFRFAIATYGNLNQPQFEICKSGNQANNDAINDVNDTLNDSSVDDPNGSLNEMNSKISTNSVISDLLLLPVSLFQNVLNSINGTCSTFNLGSLFGTNLTLTCINLSDILGSSLYGVIDVLLSGIFVLSIRKRFVDIFQNITSLKDGGNELE